jgi:hypothetical protein
MNYTVTWETDVLSVLATIWLQATDRQAVTRAQAAIDRQLTRDPLSYSTPVSEGLYAIEDPPLRVQFEVLEEDRLVTIVSVRPVP